MPINIEEEEGGIRFDILVAPRASRERIGPVVGERIKVSVTAPPTEGKANDAVVIFLARVFRVRRQDVEIVIGEKSKRKTVRVSGASRQTLMDRLHLSAQGGMK